MQIKLFDPEGIKAVDYKSVYPELNTTPEFESLSGNVLMFVWYFANKTSPIYSMSPEKRVEEAIKMAGWKMPPEQKDKILKLVFGEVLDYAIKKMESYEPGARFLGMETMKKIFLQYTKIVDDGPEGFKKEEGYGEEKTTVIDHPGYVNVSSKIATIMPGLIQNLEDGFGITVVGNSEDEEGTNFLRTWNVNRQK